MVLWHFDDISRPPMEVTREGSWGEGLEDGGFESADGK